MVGKPWLLPFGGNTVHDTNYIFEYMPKLLSKNQNMLHVINRNVIINRHRNVFWKYYKGNILSIEEPRRYTFMESEMSKI